MIIQKYDSVKRGVIFRNFCSFILNIEALLLKFKFQYYFNYYKFSIKNVFVFCK